MASMFKAAEHAQPLSKKASKEIIPALRAELLKVQIELRRSDVPVIVLFAGVDGAGKHETVNSLSEWMDPRSLVTRAYDKPSDEVAERPEFWRYWRDLPAHGQIGLFLSAWYSQPLLGRVKGGTPLDQFNAQLDRIKAFEKTLVENGAIILKFWMHLNRHKQKERLLTLSADPLTAWQVRPLDWQHWGLYDHFMTTAEHIIERTHTKAAPWLIVDGSDTRFRSIQVGQTLRDAIRKRLKAEKKAHKGKVIKNEQAKKAKADKPKAHKKKSVLAKLDLTKSLSRDTYRKQIRQYQGEVYALQQQAHRRGISTILVFEGWDAAGKGGAIRRLIRGLDARHYQVIPIAAPTDEENAHHYLWRFWRHLPRAGRVTIFDRSWYGRVLVERIEGFATEEAWHRAYEEINHFESELVRHGIVLGKFWLHISPEEQLRRFEERQQIPYKQWKLTEEDWRNRDRWGEYEAAVDDMVRRTSTDTAPWTLVEANSKLYARIKVIKTVRDRLAKALA